MCLASQAIAASRSQPSLSLKNLAHLRRRSEGSFAPFRATDEGFEQNRACVGAHDDAEELQYVLRILRVVGDAHDAGKTKSRRNRERQEEQHP